MIVLRLQADLNADVLITLLVLTVSTVSTSLHILFPCAPGLKGVSKRRHKCITNISSIMYWNLKSLAHNCKKRRLDKAYDKTPDHIALVSNSFEFWGFWRMQVSNSILDQGIFFKDVQNCLYFHEHNLCWCISQNVHRCMSCYTV